MIEAKTGTVSALVLDIGNRSYYDADFFVQGGKLVAWMPSFKDTFRIGNVQPMGGRILFDAATDWGARRFSVTRPAWRRVARLGGAT